MVLYSYYNDVCIRLTSADMDGRDRGKETCLLLIVHSYIQSTQSLLEHYWQSPIKGVHFL